MEDVEESEWVKHLRRIVRPKSHAIWKIPPIGIPENSDARYWKGERAEDIIKKRAKQYAKEKERKARQHRKAAQKRRG
jgi:hypothetical protein